jgi:hypothetical protein
VPRAANLSHNTYLAHRIVRARVETALWWPVTVEKSLGKIGIARRCLQGASVRQAKFVIALLGILIGVLASEPALAQRSGSSGRSGANHSGVHRSGTHASGVHRSGAYHPGRSYHRGGAPVFVGTFAAASAIWPWWFFPPYLQMATTTIVPLYYIEKGDDGEPADDWLYCPQTGAYFPYVEECSGGWERVPPQPPAAS